MQTWPKSSCKNENAVAQCDFKTIFFVPICTHYIPWNKRPECSFKNHKFRRGCLFEGEGCLKISEIVETEQRSTPGWESFKFDIFKMSPFSRFEYPANFNDAWQDGCDRKHMGINSPEFPTSYPGHQTAFPPWLHLLHWYPGYHPPFCVQLAELSSALSDLFVA